MPEDCGGQVTELLQNWKQGDEDALRDLLPLVYKELRRLAHYHLQSERPDHTLQSTALASPTTTGPSPRCWRRPTVSAIERSVVRSKRMRLPSPDRNLFSIRMRRLAPEFRFSAVEHQNPAGNCCPRRRRPAKAGRFSEDFKEIFHARSTSSLHGREWKSIRAMPPI